MAEKRCLEAVDAMTYSKIPRLEAAQDHILKAGLCKSSMLSGHTPDGHYSYKGSYFSYPLQCHEGPESLAHWSPAESYMHCTSGAVNQQLRTEKPVCMLYRQEAENFGARVQTARHEKGKGCVARDALTAQEKWAGYMGMGQASLVQPGWMHGFPVQHSPRAPSTCLTLAAPKPVYRNHVYCVDSGYSPKDSSALGMQVESAPKRPLDAEWTVPPSGHPIHMESQSREAVAPKKSLLPESSLRLQPDTDVTPVGFSPYRKTFEKCKAAQSPPFLNPNYPAAYSGQKHVPEVRGGSPGNHAWTKGPPLASPLGNSPTLMYHDRSSSCYPLPSYPLSPHEQMLLYHQNYPQAEKQNSIFALPACKSFTPPGSEELQALPRSYFPPGPRSYYPGPLESYLYRTGGPPSMTSPGTNQEYELQHNSRAKTDFLPQNAPSACMLPEKVAYCGSGTSQGSLRDWCDRGSKPTNESLKSVATQPHAFQSLPSAEKLPSCFGDLWRTQEAECRVGNCQLDKTNAQEGEPLGAAHKSPSLTSEVKKRSAEVAKAEPGSCIVICDSPVTPQDSSHKGNSLKNTPKDSGSSLQHMVQPPEERTRDLNQPEDSPPPSSPPMPVIHNVFSLAPYREYLERAGRMLLSKSGRIKEPDLQDAYEQVAGKQTPQPASTGSSEASGVLLPRWKETTHNALAEADKKDPSSHCTVTEGESGDYVESWESSKMKALPPSRPGLRQLVPADGEDRPGVEGLAKDEPVLDLSLKTEGLVDVPILQRSCRKTEALERESSRSKGEEATEQPAKGQEAFPEANLRPLELPVQSGSGEKSNFQSSAAFLFKKFKILKSHASGAGAVVHQGPPPLRPSSQPEAQTSSCSLQQGSESATPPRKSQAQPSSVQLVTWPVCLPVQQLAQPVAIQPKAPSLQQNYLNVKLPDTSKPLPPSAPASSPALGETSVSLPTTCDSPAQQTSSGPYFSALHTSLCDAISSCVSAASPEQLKEWTKKASDTPKPSKGKEIWLAFKDVAGLLTKLLSQLETFLFTHKCPFPHVVRAGTIFIPIHIVKEKLFPGLSGSSVDHVLQDHKVELRPTTLSEEKLLRDLELKSCTSRMLKLLALKQLPDMYPELLNLHWHDCVRQQLGDPALGILNTNIHIKASEENGLKGTEVTRRLQNTTTVSLGLCFRRKWKQSQKCGSVPQSESMGLPAKTFQPVDDEMPQGPSSTSVKQDAALREAKGLPQEDAPPVELKTKRLPCCPGSKRQLFQVCKRPRTLQVKLTSDVARKTSTSKVLCLQKSVVHIKFQNALQDIQGPPVRTASEKKGKKPVPLLMNRFSQQRRHARRSAVQPGYPELVGKRIRHLYEEKDKTEAWYRGVVLRVHKHHKNPLKTVYEVKYDSEPEWQYYLEILQDYKRGWLEVDE
ncbi:uncharacterized protein C15orf39 homolog [Tiliqua scincoides]|uniref:uncharacterized protein C15orf39 homolog n=1 Tax=Tiliqua scincoides TaxID=71010 RepID=UPI00346223D9